MKENISKIKKLLGQLPQSVSARRSENPDVQKALERQRRISELSATNSQLTDEQLKRLIGN